MTILPGAYLEKMFFAMAEPLVQPDVQTGQPHLAMKYDEETGECKIFDRKGRQFRVPSEPTVKQCWECWCPSAEYQSASPVSDSEEACKAETILLTVGPGSSPEERTRFSERLSGYCWIVV